MRALIMATPVSSHFAPMIPLAWALRAAGHEVLVAGQPDITGMATAAGLPTAVIGDTFDAIEAIAAGLPAGKRPNEAGRAQMASDNPLALAQPWLIHAKYLVSPYRDFAERWRPDVILSDPFEFAALAVGGLLGIPVVHHRWHIDTFGAQHLAIAEKVLGGRFRRMGLPELPAPDLVLDASPPSLRPAGAEPAGHIRYIPFNGTGSVPSWAAEKGAGKRVVITFGRLTAELNGVPLFRHAIDAASALPDVEAVVTLERGYRDELGPVPSGVRVVDPAPLNLFLDTADLVVHHGAFGTLFTASTFGLPQLVLPQLADEAQWGERLADCGAAKSVADPAAQNDPAVLREAMRALLGESGYAAGARKLADEIAAQPSPAEVVKDIEKLVTEGR